MTAQSSYVRIFSSSLSGKLTLPPSKSHTMRALLLASMAQRTTPSRLENLLLSPDTMAMIHALEKLGATICYDQEKMLCSHKDRFSALVYGTGACTEPIQSEQENRSIMVDVGNSGQVLRFTLPFFCFHNRQVCVTGDQSIQTLRPMTCLIDALQILKASSIQYLYKKGYAPFTICGPISHGFIVIDGTDSQPVSALLLSLPFLPGCGSHIQIENMGEKAWIDFTLWWLEKSGIQYKRISENQFFLPGGQTIAPLSYYSVPADLSSLAFPLVIALLTPSDITFTDIDLSDPQGDKRIIPVLEKLGAVFEYDFLQKTLRVQGPQYLCGDIDIDMSSIIDALPALAIACACSYGKSRLYNAFSARQKESDRLSAISFILRCCSVDIEEEQNEITIIGRGKNISAAPNTIFSTHNDHRIAMTLAILGAISSPENSIIFGPITCIEKSFPLFFKTLHAIGFRYEFCSKT